MIEVNRLSAPGERAALERVEAIAQRIDELPVDRFVPSRHAMPDPDEHARLVAELEAAADASGRRPLLDDVRERVGSGVRIRLENRWVDAFSRASMFPHRAEDAALVEMALVDAAAVAVVEDRLDPDVAARLSASGRALLGLPSVGAAPADADSALPGEPTAEDWAEAAAGDAQTGGYRALPVGLRVGVAVVAAVALAPAAVLAGAASGQTLVGMLGGLAVLAVCWLVATYRPAA